MKKLKIIILIFALSITGVNFATGLSDVYALEAPYSIVADASHDNACAGLNQVGGTKCGEGQQGLDNVLSGVVKIISYLAGIIAIIMVIVSGIRFTTSGGDAAKVGGAKTSLVYALIGVAVAVLAQVLVHYVIGTAVK